MASYGRGEFNGLGTYQSSSGTDSSSSEHGRLAQKVGNGIQKITQNVSQLKKLVNQMGTDADSEELRGRVHQTIHYNNQLAKETNTNMKDFAHLSTPSNASEQRQFKMQKERLADEFGSALKSFQTIQRTAAEKEKASVARARANSSQAQSYGPDSQFDVKFGTNSDQTPGYSATRQILQMEQDIDLDIIKEREQSIKKLESDIVDVNHIFKDLGMLVHEQGEVLDSIEANIDSTQLSVQEGTQQLGKARKYQTKSRKMKCCLAVVILLVLIIVAIIIAVEVPRN